MTSFGWELVGHLVLAPILALSASPWTGGLILLVRVVLSLLLLLAVRTVILAWLARCCRRSDSVPKAMTGWLMPLLVVGLGLLLMCSTNRGFIDRLFQQTDRVLMNGRFAQPASEVGTASWYEVLDMPEQGNPSPDNKDKRPGHE